jgi:hypothetical protein
LGKEWTMVTKITVEPVVPVTMNLPSVRVSLAEHANVMRPNVTARLTSPLMPLAMCIACCCVLPTPAHAADGAFDPGAMPPVLSDSGADPSTIRILDDRIVLDPDSELVPGPTESVMMEGGSLDAALGGGPIVESIVAPPQILDVSARGAEGMLLDDSQLDEMPYEASSGQWFRNGGWYAGAESMWLSRSRNQRVTLGVDESTSTAPFLKYTTVSNPFNMGPGARVTIGKSIGRDYLDRDQAVEYVYYGGFNYAGKNGFNSLTSAPLLITPLAAFSPGFNFANSFNTTYSSDFNSMELNYKLSRGLGRDQLVMSPGGNWTRHAERGWLPALILGLRAANVNENFSFISRRTNVSPTAFGGDYNIATQNWLFGLNIGGELISRNEFYYWGLRGRATPALSWAADQQRAIGVNATTFPQGGQGTTNLAYATSEFGPGFLGDLTLLAGWNITPNFALQVGYDFLWVAGIATATRQFNLDNRDQYPLDAGGQIFYNGLSFGFNGSW